MKPKKNLSSPVLLTTPFNAVKPKEYKVLNQQPPNNKFSERNKELPWQHYPHIAKRKDNNE